VKKYITILAVLFIIIGLGLSWLSLGKADMLRSAYVAEPVAGLSPEESDMLYLASLAPSGHNTQPWTVRVQEPGRWIIGSHQSRWLPQVDPENRELLLSIGAFLENLSLAAGMHGYQLEINVLAQDSHAADLVEVHFVPGAFQEDWRDKIVARRTLRSTQAKGALKKADVDYLVNQENHIRYYSLDSEQGRYLAEGTLAANKAQAFREPAQVELANWIRWSNADEIKYRNGLTPEGMELSGIARWYTKNFFNQQSVLEQSFREETIKKVAEQVDNCGGWIVVTSPSNSIDDTIHAGMLLEKIWLKAVDRKIAFHPMTQMLEESPWKDTIRKDLGFQYQIQFIVRVGYVKEYLPPVSLRMPLGNIVK
jgi:hypothetical protein